MKEPIFFTKKGWFPREKLNKQIAHLKFFFAVRCHHFVEPLSVPDFCWMHQLGFSEFFSKRHLNTANLLNWKPMKEKHKSDW